MKVALVYDRVNKWGGAERVLLALNELFPDAPLYTAVYHPKRALWAKKFPKVIPTLLNKVPYFRDKHELLGTFTPIAFETFDFSDYDLVISVTSEAAKGIITKPPTIHICYCLTPTRYLWSAYDLYFRNPLLKIAAKPAVAYLRYWDKIAAQRPDIMIGISTTVCHRIKKYYGRYSELVYPPVNLEKFGKQIKNPEVFYLDYSKGGRRGFYLVVSRLTPYKRVDLAIEAFNKLELPLIIVGKGSEEKKLMKMAKSNIKFVRELTDGQLAGYYQRARALILPQEEDFGIVAVEAQAAGTPVIAYKAGGALDTVIGGVTGIFFNKQESASLIKAVRNFEKMKFDKKDLLKNAQKFSKERFKKEFLKIVEDVKR